MNRTISSILCASFLTAPIIANGALIFQYDYNDTLGASTLDSQFPDSPAVTGVAMSGGGSTFDPDVPSSNTGGFSGNLVRGTIPDETGLIFDLGAPHDWDTFTAFTITTWVKPTSATGQMRPFHGSGQFWLQRNNATTMQVKFGPNTSAALSTPADTWTFVAITYDGTDYNFYSMLEGEVAAPTPESTITAAGHSPASTPFDSTVHTSHPGNASQGWDGNLDNLRIYDNALTPAELFSVYTYNDTVIPEPSEYAAIFGVCTLLGVLLHRRRKAIA